MPLDKWNLKFIAVLYGSCVFIITLPYFFIAIHIFKAYRKQNTLNMDTSDSEKGTNALIMRSNPNYSRTYRFTLMFFHLTVVYANGLYTTH